MPTLSRIFCKTSILYLVLGAVLGALLLLNLWLNLSPQIPVLKVSHAIMLLVGWLTQLIMGVAWWLFPPLDIELNRDSHTPVRRGQTQRGSQSLFWAVFALLNAGVLLRAIFAPLYAWTQIGAFDLLGSISGLFLLAAASAFVAAMWQRVRELGRARAS